MNGKIYKNITLFGATGDLSYRKLMPALYDLYVTKNFTDNDRIIAIGRRDYSDLEYKDIIKSWILKGARMPVTDKIFKEFSKKIVYLKMDFTDKNSYKILSNLLCKDEVLENIFYYAVAPRFFPIISEGVMSLDCLAKTKVILEKPFGETIEDAKKISETLDNFFGKENIYRIDHYLGKEMVQNISVVRFENPIFENSWNRELIECVKIYASESLGVLSRASYYDKSGALKDMVQNHLMQILTLVAMEKPCDKICVKDAQLNVLKSLRPIEELDIKKHIILGQYRGYLDEDGVSKSSKTETFAMLKIFIDNDRWRGVPFYIITGKGLKERLMKIDVSFKSSVNKNNKLVFNVQPLEGISFRFKMKEAGESDEIIDAKMDFSSEKTPSYRMNTPEAYERLLNACINSDNTWFSSWEQIYLSWKYIEDLKARFDKDNLEVYTYEKGSKGPCYDLIK